MERVNDDPSLIGSTTLSTAKYDVTRALTNDTPVERLPLRLAA